MQRPPPLQLFSVTTSSDCKSNSNSKSNSSSANSPFVTQAETTRPSSCSGFACSCLYLLVSHIAELLALCSAQSPRAKRFSLRKVLAQSTPSFARWLSAGPVYFSTFTGTYPPPPNIPPLCSLRTFGLTILLRLLLRNCYLEPEELDSLRCLILNSKLHERPSYSERPRVATDYTLFNDVDRSFYRGRYVFTTLASPDTANQPDQDHSIAPPPTLPKMHKVPSKPPSS